MLVEFTRAWRIFYGRSVSYYFLFSFLHKRHVCRGDLRSELYILHLQTDIPCSHGAKEDYVQSETMGLMMFSKSGLKMLLHDFMNQRRQEASVRNFETNF